MLPPHSPAPGFFDAHSHLGLAPDPIADWRVVCGTCEADWDAVLNQAIPGSKASQTWILPMLGLHPWQVQTASDQWAPRLESLLRSHRAGLGECGLDFTRKEADRAAQEAAFRLQLRLAHALHRPVAIHAVRAWGRLIDLLKTEEVPAAGALVHAFGGSPEIACALQNLGLYLSFSGDLMKPGRDQLRASLRVVEPSRLLLETDGTGDLGAVMAAAAQLLNVSVAELAAQTCENGLRCFKELMA
ncbi:TatD family hydrolase [Geothrix sp. PMB-07]|uniref:TatD family hydrolase n=1 Tax=Geothrix sp. PMB-07 TaxID=3068640 RepID=UPI0027415FE6|nr:TatD family hydrolase [Geothrix sp. PMB-07]WLT32646.1 TatD family hydrolase [Geothrix sp. PMB-07]